MRLEGKTALITGGGRGTGQAIALRFAREGACVAIVGPHKKTLDDTVAKGNGIEPIVRASEKSRAWRRHEACSFWSIQIVRDQGTPMAAKPGGALCVIREQIVEDAASGLVLQFECREGRARLMIVGKSLPFGNREIVFDSKGKEAAAGTLVGGGRRPSWLKKVA